MLDRSGLAARLFSEAPQLARALPRTANTQLVTRALLRELPQLAPPPRGAALTDELATMRMLEPLRSPMGNARAAWLAGNTARRGQQNVWSAEAASLTRDLSGATPAAVEDALRAVREEAYEASERLKLLRPVSRPPDLDPGLSPVLRHGGASYPSGHSAISAAAGEVLKAYAPQRAGHYERLVREAAFARLYGGVHSPTDVRAGVLMGREIGRAYVRQHGIRPLALTGGIARRGEVAEDAVLPGSSVS